MALILVLITIFQSILPMNSQWITNTPSMPISGAFMSVGYYQNIIYVIHGKALIEYHINNNTFTYNQTFFTKNIFSIGQCWVQTDNMLYITGLTDSTINIFNLKTKQFNCLAYNSSRCVSAPIYGQQDECLAISNDHQSLYYVGGINPDYLNLLQILNLSTLSWSNGPNMNTTRIELSCIVSSNDKLYAIGGDIHAGSPFSIFLLSIFIITYGKLQMNRYHFH